MLDSDNECVKCGNIKQSNNLRVCENCITYCFCDGYEIFYSKCLEGLFFNFNSEEGIVW